MNGCPPGDYNDAETLRRQIVDYRDPETLRQLIGPHAPMPSFYSPSQVRHEAGERVPKLLSSYRTLGDILARHEATIHKRWAKKTKQQRLKILLDCWPTMAKPHRPDFNAIRTAEPGVRPVSTRLRENFVWPYINQDDLSGPRELLLLLNARGRHHPCQFAAADVEAMRLGRITMAVLPIFLNEHVMLLNGVEDDSYGKLLSWNEHPDAFRWLYEKKQFSPGQGLLILEAQERLLAFLVDCCKAMFHDIPPAKLLSDEYPPQPEPTQAADADADGFESQAVMAEQAPYRLPAKLDLKRMSALLQAHADAAKDHAWALREDPAYFVDELADITAHRQEMMRDTNGQAHPVFAPNRIDRFTAYVVYDLIEEAYTDLEIFVGLHKQATSLQDQYEPIPAGQDLPDDYLDAILLFRHHLQQAAERLQLKLQHSAPVSPLLKSFFVRLPPSSPTTTITMLTTKPNSKRTEAETYLIYLLDVLWSDDKQLFYFGLPLLMDELDRQLQAPAFSNLMSPRIASLLSSLSIIAQCLGQLGQYYPWARRFEDQAEDQADDLQRRYAQWRKPLDSILITFHKGPPLELVRPVDNPTKRFHYPVEKRRTKANVEALRLAESNLDDFWSTADRFILRKGGSFTNTAFQSMRSARTLQRTAPWVEPPKEAKAKTTVAAVNDSLADLDIGPRPSSLPTAPKVKTKTRGVARDDSEPARGVAGDDAEPAPASTTPASATKIPVDAKSLKTFRKLFFAPDTSSSPGEVPWRDFVRAMTASGFRAEKLYGSAWQFQGPQSSIQFHEPHPHDKLPFYKARRYGRRLNRAFGWDGDTFVLDGGE